MHIYHCFLFLALCDIVFCERCVTVDFENGLEGFTNTFGRCAMWNTKSFNTDQYSSRNMISPHPRSTRFIEPRTLRSCITSFNFTMTGGGTLEVNGYTFNNSPVALWADIYDARNNSLLRATSLTRWNSVWEPRKIIIPGSVTFPGYVLFETTRASNESVGFIDSFRYIPPSVDKNSCVIYKEETTTTASTTTTTTQAPTTLITTTEEPTTTSTSTEVPTATTTVTEASTTTTTEVSTATTPVTESSTTTTSEAVTTTTSTTPSEVQSTTTTASTEAPPRLTKLSITKFLKIDKYFS